MTTDDSTQHARRGRRRNLLVAVVVIAAGAAGTLIPLFSSTSRAFAVARYLDVLGEAAVAELSRLTFAETALLQLSVITACAGALWLTALILLSWRDSRRGRGSDGPRTGG